MGSREPVPVRSFVVINRDMRNTTMFGLNRAEVIGRLGADVTVNHLTSGGRVANLSIATDESYIDRNSGQREERTEWHRVVSFQPGLIDMLEKHAQQGPARLRLRQAADAALEEGRRRIGSVLHRDPARPRRSRSVPRSPERSQQPRRARGRAAGRRGARRRSRWGHRRDSVLNGL